MTTHTQRPDNDGWMAVIIFIILGLLLLWLMTSCASYHYIDDFEGADTVYMHMENKLFEIKG